MNSLMARGWKDLHCRDLPMIAIGKIFPKQALGHSSLDLLGKEVLEVPNDKNPATKLGSTVKHFYQLGSSSSNSDMDKHLTMDSTITKSINLSSVKTFMLINRLVHTKSVDIVAHSPASSSCSNIVHNIAEVTNENRMSSLTTGGNVRNVLKRCRTRGSPLSDFTNNLLHQLPTHLLKRMNILEWMIEGMLLWRRLMFSLANHHEYC
uniref:Uncharacterized protein n=1 Tax=Cannabis sativa TaxID=3483 RepID=A0A803NFN5_CANSA